MRPSTDFTVSVLPFFVIRKTVAAVVTSVQTCMYSRASYQDVASMCLIGASRACANASSCAAASASLARRSQVLIAPSEMRTPSISQSSACAARRLSL